MSHKPDKEFNARKAANMKRKLGSVSSVPSSSTESPANVDDTGAGMDAEQQEDNEKDPEYITPSKKGRSDRKYLIS